MQLGLCLPATLSFHLSVNMYVFNVKSYTEYHFIYHYHIIYHNNFPALNPSYRNLLSLVVLPSSLGHIINYLLTGFVIRTVKY